MYIYYQSKNIYKPGSDKREVFRQKERSGFDEHFAENLKRLSLLITKPSVLELVYVMRF